MSTKIGKPKDTKLVFMPRLAAFVTMVKGFILMQVISMVPGTDHFRHLKLPWTPLTRQRAVLAHARSVFPSSAIRKERL